MNVSTLIGRVLLATFLGSGVASCDKLGMGGKKEETAEKASDSDSADESDEDGDKKKKKKKKKKSDDETPTATAAPTPAPTPPPTPAPTTPTTSGEAKRYTGETPDSGQLAISKTVPARKEADRKSEVVVTLQPGSAVTRVARYGGYVLVTWTNKSGEHFGWVELSQAVSDRQWDGGVQGVEGLGTRTDAGTRTTVDAGKLGPPPGLGTIK